MAWKINARYPLGINRVSDDGRYEVFSAKPGSGHMGRYPGDPMRHILYRVTNDDALPEGGYVTFLSRHYTLASAKAAAAQDRSD